MAQVENTNSLEEYSCLEGLQSLLRQGLNCNDLEVVDCKAKKLLPVGENYCSILVKIEATIRKSRSDKDEKLDLAAKTASPTENPVIDWTQLLPKEVFVYKELLPAYQSLEREMGIEESELCSVLPKYMGHRFSLDGDDKVDETGLLLMENLISQDFYVCNRFKGVDFEHAQKALSELARYHALGIVTKQRRPEFFQKVIAQAQVLGMDLEQTKIAYKVLKKNFQDNQCFDKHISVIECSFDKIMKQDQEMKLPSEPWATINHGDFWTNNMLFHKDADGNVDDVKFVDFQMYFYTSPIRDLPYFFCTSLDETTKNQCIDKLLSVYYDTFIKTLKHMDCDTSAFTKQSFDRELKVRAIEVFPIISLAQKFIKHEVESDKDSNEIMKNLLNNDISNAFRDKMLKLVEFYENKEWF